jgi:alpha-L-fucosidase
MDMKQLLFPSLVLAGLLAACQSQPQDRADVPVAPLPVVPTAQQVAYQAQELVGFAHFGVNTFTDREWGTGQEDPQIFNPTAFDARQWVRACQEAGMGTLILTAKHHDGFCLWPSKLTDHSVASSPWKNGQGDMVREVADACREAGLKLGLYLSPWDMHEPSYGTDRYNAFYLGQLRELMTQYGPVAEVWFDGAKGPNAKDMVYDFAAYRQLVRELQPDALMFSDEGPDIRWIGNEKGIAGPTNWSMLHPDSVEVGKADQGYLNRGDPQGTHWIVGECDVSIRPGWFYHAKEDTAVKSLDHLVDLYYKSVGRNGTLLLNIPPDRRGRFHETDVARLGELRAVLNQTFGTNLASRQPATATNQRAGLPRYAPSHLTDGDPATYWATDDSVTAASAEVRLAQPQTLDRASVQEYVQLGQRVQQFALQAWVGGQWQTLAQGTTIGYKRLLRFAPVTTDRVRLVVQQATACPVISELGLFRASPKDVGQAD